MDLMSTAQLLGNFGEFVGAIAVVTTLGYLAIQVRQNTRSSYVDRAAAARQQLSRMKENVVCNQDLADLVARCRNEGLGDLTPADEERVEGLAQFYLIMFADIETAHRNGELADDRFEVFRAEFERILATYPALKPRMRAITKHFGEDAVAEYEIYRPLFG